MRCAFFFLILSPIISFAQAHVRLFDEPTRVWTSELYGPAIDQLCADHWLTTHWLAGDTVINDTTYQRVASRILYYQSHILGGANDCQAYTHYPGSTSFVRERDSLVFVRTSTGEQLIYDFTAGVGDSIPQPTDAPWPWGVPAVSGEWTTVTGIDSVEVNGSFRKRFIVEPGPEDWTNETQHVIEGIGGERGPFWTMVSIVGVSHSQAIVCVAEHGEVVFSGPNANCSFVTSIAEEGTRHALHITPNPSDGLFRVSGLAPSQRYMVLDAAGRTIVTGSTPELDMRPYPDGLYLLRAMGKDGNVVDAQRLLIQR
ncbi:MAG TPA: hypothetical protein PKN30_13770 [Flavobacteriales bacterium]|nr:hypothetical protein [Flavobacteriales bacterium]